MDITILFVTDGAWGDGIHRRLTAPEGDANLWAIKSALTAIFDHASSLVVSIDDFTVVDDQFFVHLNDGNTLGPYTLPVSRLSPQGDWQPITAYFKDDAIVANGALYVVQADHTSAASFNAGANDGHGGMYYGLYLPNPGSALPTGGAVDQFVKKSTTDDFATKWGWAYLAELKDIDFPSGMGAGWTLVSDGHEGYTFTPPAATSLSMEELSDADMTAVTDGDVVRRIGTVWTNQAFSAITFTLAQLRFGTQVALSSSGSASLDPTQAIVFTLSPTGDVTISATEQIQAAEIEVIIHTVGSTTYNVDFDAGSFASAGTLATGTDNDKYYTVCFRSEGTLWIEKSRSGPY